MGCHSFAMKELSVSHMESTPGVFHLVSTFSLSPFSFCVLWLEYISYMLSPSESLTRG